MIWKLIVWAIVSILSLYIIGNFPLAAIVVTALGILFIEKIFKDM
jgi:hypothetical protein